MVAAAAAASVAPRRAAISLATSRRLANGSLLPRALAATTVNSSPASRHPLRPIHTTPARFSDPYPEDPRQRFSPSRAYVPLQERPLDMPFILPDGSAARVVENGEHNVISVSHEGKDVARFERQVGDKKRVSLHGVVKEERAQSEDVWKLSVEPKGGQEEIRAAWIGVYGFWLRRDPYERLPILVDSPRIQRYLISTGLGFAPPDSQAPNGHILLDRGALYQGAGAPRGLSFLQEPQHDGEDYGLAPSSYSFPHLLSFTSGQSAGPPFSTVHPLRPPKPSPGTLLYSRFQPSVSSLFQLHHLDPSSPLHFEAYKRWQNSDRVNVGWKERGPDEHHKRTLEGVLEDEHKMSFIYSWDGQPAGYAEASWNSEDAMSPFAGPRHIGAYDQGVHLLVGEEKFRGKHRFAATSINLRHYCFLREPRTEVVVGEPRYDLGIISLHKAYLPQEIVKEVELPHKRAVFFKQHRERFFLEAGFW